MHGYVLQSHLVSSRERTVRIERRGGIDLMHFRLEFGAVVRVPDAPQEHPSMDHLMQQRFLELLCRPVLHAAVSVFMN